MRRRGRGTSSRNSGTGASSFAASPIFFGASNRPSCGEGSLSISCRVSSCVEPSASSAFTPSKTPAHLPQRTLPPRADSCAGCTRKAVPQLGHLVVRFMGAFRYIASGSSSTRSFQQRPAFVGHRYRDVEVRCVGAGDVSGLGLEDARERDAAAAARARGEQRLQRNQGTGEDVGEDQVVVSRRQGVGKLRSEEHTSELQSQSNLVCRLLLEK